MKVFKAIICLVLTTLIFIAADFSNLSAHADGDSPEIKKYAYADLGSSAYFCEKPDEKTALFQIPQTYCVEILSEEKDWFRVKYAEDNGIYRAVEGFCLKADLIPCDTPLENTYLHAPITIVYHTDEASGMLPSLGDIEVTAAFYGVYEVGKTSCSYVLCNDKFGYIPRVIEDYPLNPLPDKPTVAPAQKGGGNAALIAAIVVSAAAAAAIIIIYITGKRSVKTVIPPQ